MFSTLSSVQPGLTALTVIPRPASPTAKYRTSASSAALAEPIATQGCRLPVRLPAAYVTATILPPGCSSAAASRAPTRNAFAWELNATSHCSRLISIGPWKNSGSSGRALLTKTSSRSNSPRTRSNSCWTCFGCVTSPCTTRPSEPRSLT